MSSSISSSLRYQFAIIGTLSAIAGLVIAKKSNISAETVNLDWEDDDEEFHGNEAENNASPLVI